MMSDKTEAFAERLVKAVPSLEESWREHRRDFGAQAPDAFLDMATFATASRYLAGQSTTELPAVLAFLESDFGHDDKTDALIARSFLAKLRTPEDPRREALGLLGPKLRAALDRQERGEGIPIPTPTVALVQRLVGAEPSLSADLQEHLEFYDELLPHLFFGEVAPRVVGWVQSGDPTDSQRAQAVLDTLEAVYRKDYESDELITASFIENLPRSGDGADAVQERMGPKLRAEFGRQRSIGD